MATNGKNPFLEIPTAKGLWTALAVIVVFLALGGGLYYFANKGFNEYLAKIGDCFIQGALISIMFAILKAMIDKPNWRQILPFLGKADSATSV